MGTWYFHAYPQASGYNAFHAKGINQSGQEGTFSNVATAGALFGRTWNLSGAFGSAGYIAYPGNFNLPTNRARTYHIRLRSFQNGPPAGTAFGMFGITGIYQLSGNFNNGIGLFHGTDGTLRAYIGSNIPGFGQILSNANMGTWTPTIDVPYDIQLVWDGTNTANAVKVYLNGALLGQATTSQSWVTPTNNFFQGTIMLGQSTITTGTGFKIEEFAIGDGADFDLSGFTGVSRSTNLINLPAYSGISFPAVAKVKNDTSWNEFGVAKTGTRTDPAATQVKNGVQYGAGGTEFTGNVTLPPANTVFEGTQYGANGNEFTGSLEVEATDPGVDNVLEGIAYNILGVPKVGTYKTVSPSDVRYPIAFGPNGSLIGQSGQPNTGLNPYWAPLETQKSIFDYLATDETLIELLGETYGTDPGEVETSSRVFDYVPDNTRFPYVRMQILPFVARDNATKEGFEVEFQIDVWYRPGKSTTTGRGNKQVQLIQQRVDQLLQNREICIDGWNSISILRTYIDIIRQDDNVTLQGVQRFKLLLGGK